MPAARHRASDVRTRTAVRFRLSDGAADTQYAGLRAELHSRTQSSSPKPVELAKELETEFGKQAVSVSQPGEGDCTYPQLPSGFRKPANKRMERTRG
jgi:hypothetical protein